MIPGFISGSHGSLFTVYFPPAPDTDDGGDVIYVPPFAEEMNRSRAVVAAQARHLQSSGFGVLILDLYGTGDSAGDFADARWEAWREDLVTAADWLAGKGRPLWGIWGLRLGALLAADTAGRAPDRFRRLLLWDPVTSGKDYLDRFLKIAATSPNHEARGIAAEGDRIRLSHDGPLEVAGYPISRSLMHGILRTQLNETVRNCAIEIDWLDLRDRGDARRIDVDAVRNALHADAALRHRVLAVQPFWSVQDTVADPNLFDATAETLRATL
ncbi:MAG: hydrolase 2, exosortase A system-associated [Alphaproteobacteria bacterium]